MHTGWRIGSLLGIPMFLDPSWFIILILFTIANEQVWQMLYPKWGLVLTWSAGLLISLLMFVSVVLHELGHSLVARSQGIKVTSITLFLFGGIAAIDRESKTPGEALQVAIAGPVVSLTIYALLTLLVQLIQLPEPVRVLTRDLADLNLVLGIFNLIPGLPLDGGQVLKAIVWKITGNRFQGVHWAARSGKVLGWGAILSGLGAFFLGGRDGVGGLWVVLLGWFAVRNANNYDHLTDLQEALLKLTAAEVMTRDFRVVNANLTLREFADNYLLEATKPQVYFAAADGRYRGQVSALDLQSIERSQWEIQHLHQIVHTLTEIISVSEKNTLVEVINRMETHQLRQITVLSPAGTVAGIIDRGDIVQALGNDLGMEISTVAIAQIKSEGTYPPGLQLNAIAKSLE